jgi:hypothetical protein
MVAWEMLVAVIHPSVALGLAALQVIQVTVIMAHVVQPLDQPSNYKDSQSRIERHRQNELLAKSSTLYVRTSSRLFDLPSFRASIQLCNPDWQFELLHNRRADLRALQQMQ